MGETRSLAAERSARIGAGAVEGLGTTRAAAQCDAALGPAYAGIAVGALAVLGATAVGLRWASRPPAVRTITMGPGGWVSFKGVKPPPLAPRRPWWAVLLRAQPVAGT